MFSNVIDKKERNRKKNIIINSPQRKIINKKPITIENINELVDNIFAISKVKSIDNNENIKRILRAGKRLSLKKMISVALSFLLLFAIIASASSLVVIDDLPSDSLDIKSEYPSLENSTNPSNGTIIIPIINETNIDNISTEPETNESQSLPTQNNNSDDIDTTYTIEEQNITGLVAPTVLTNASTGIGKTNATLNGWLKDNGSADTTCYIIWGIQNPPIDNNISIGTIDNDEEFSFDTNLIESLKKGTLYYIDSKAVNSEGWDESGGVKAFLSKPDSPDNLTAQENSSTMIYLSWESGEGANNTYIERNIVSSWARGSGTEVFNGSSTYFEDYDVSDEITYYYQAWSYSTWSYNTTIHQWSDNYDFASSKTNNLPIILNEFPENEATGIHVLPQMSITINYIEADSLNITWYSNSTGSWQIFATNNSVSNGTYCQTNKNFSDLSKKYYWYVSVSTDSGVYASNIFYFTTESLETSIDKLTQENQIIWDNFSAFLLNNNDIQLNPASLNVTVSDPKSSKMNIFIMTNESGIWTIVNQSTGYLLTNGTYSFTNTSWIDSYNTKYWVSFNVTNGLDWTNKTYSFTTITSPPTGIPYENIKAQGNYFGLKELNSVNIPYFWDLIDYYADWAVEESSDNATWFRNNTDLKVYHDRGSNDKLTLNFTAPENSYYRIVLYFKKPLIAYWDNSAYYVYTLKFAANETENYTIYFNWSDYAQSDEVSITSCDYGIKNIEGNDFFYWIVTTNDPLNADESLQIDPTFGNSAEGSSGLDLENTIRGSRFQVLENVSAVSISAYLYYKSSQQNQYSVKAAIYNDTENLVGSTNEISVYSSQGATNWHTFTLNSQQYLAANNYYYLVVWADDQPGSSAIQLRYSSASSNYHYVDQTYGTWPSSVSFTSPVSSYEHNIYCTFTYNNESIQSGETPSNETTNICPIPNLSVTCIDNEDDTMNATWWSNSSGSWKQFASNTSIANNTIITQTNLNFSQPGTTYYWRVILTDGEGGMSNKTYHFTTNYAPTQTDPWPENEQAGVPLTPTLNITISDLDNDIMTAYWLSNSTGSWEIFGTNSSVSTGTTIYQTNSNFSEKTTFFWWSVNVTDGCNWTNVTYRFTTSYIPLQKNQSIWDGFSCFLLNNTDVPVNITSFNITISDTDGQKMNVTILTNSSGSWSIVNQSSGAGLSNGTHGFTNTSWVDSYDTQYWISFNLTDGICWSNETFNFTTVTSPPTGEPYEHKTANGSAFGSNNWNETNHTFFWDFVDYYGIWAVEESSDNVTWFKNNTVLDISTSQSSDNERKKFTLNFTANKYGYYRLVMNFKKPLLAYWDNSTFYEYSLKFAANASENYTIYFNWSDFIGSVEALITTCDYGVKTVDGDDYFYWIVTTNDPLNADESLEIDPTFGDENEGTSGDSLENTIRGSYFQMPENGNANNISAYLYYKTSGPNFYNVKAAIYNSNSDLVGSTSERSLSNTGGIATWENFTFSSPPFLTENENYYLVIWADLPSGSNTIQLRYLTGINNNNYSSQSYGAWPNSVSFLDEPGFNQYNIYCTYTPNNLSVISFPGPANESSGIGPRPVCNVTVYDQDGGTVDVYFYENTTGDDTWVLQQTNSSVDVTSPANVEWDNYSNATVESTIYWWRVVVTDEIGATVEDYFQFTTVGITVSITPNTWHQGTLTVGSSNETESFYFEITNDGSTSIDLQIKASNATNATTGANWKLNETVGLDNYTLQYNLSDGGTTWTNINLTFDTFVNNLASSSSKTFDLKLILATYSSKSDPLEITLTFRSVLS